MGTYPINCSGLTSPNYIITWVAGTLNVTPVPLTNTANYATRVWGFANPAFTAKYTDFVNGDTATSLGGTLVCTTTATPTSVVGTYPINCSGRTSTNYTITYAPGTLTVTNAIQISPLSLTFAAQNIGKASNFPVVSVTNIGGAALTTLRPRSPVRIAGTLSGAAETVAALAARLFEQGLLAPSTSGSGPWPRVFGLPACR